MFEIPEKQPVRVKIYGKEFSLKKPTLSQVETLQSKVSASDDKSSLSFTKEFLMDSGLPSDLISELEVEHVISLVELLSGSKKK